MNKFKTGYLLMIFVFLYACRGDGGVITKEDTDQVDSLIARERFKIDSYYNQQCSLNYKKYYQTAYDSIMIERLKAIEKLKNLSR